MTIDRERLLRLLTDHAPAGSGLRLPPPCLVEMQGEPVEYVEGELLVMRFPVLERWQNPLGFMQGGFIAAALDNTLGPFSYLVAPPSVTTQFNLSFLRPIPPQMPWFTCSARSVDRSAQTLHLAGEALDPDGKRLALAHAACRLLPARPA